LANDTGGGWFSDVAANMNQFASAAAAGGFAINETGGEALLTAIRDMYDWLNSRMNDLRVFEEKLPLGGSHGAEVVKPFTVQVATDQQGFLTQLTALQESLAKAEEGIKQAMDNYRAADQDGKQGLPSA